MSAVATEQEFRDRAIAVHHWRGELARLRAALAAQQAFFEAENAELLNSIADATVAMSGHETMLRDLTLATYRETGDKRRWRGVAIRVSRALYYEAEAALAWAKEHGLALALDVKTFKAIAQVQPLEFVRIKEEAQATIAQDLGAALGPKTDGDEKMQADWEAAIAKVWLEREAQP